MIYLFDIDGTLADISHRLHFIQKEPADWNSFYQAAGSDSPLWDTITVARALSGQRLIMVTGRTESIREITVSWLRKYRIPFESIYMRKDGDHREDNVVKSELLDQILAANPQTSDSNKIAAVFEDRQQVVDMFRARGLRVYQVAPGKF